MSQETKLTMNKLYNHSFFRSGLLYGLLLMSCLSCSEATKNSKDKRVSVSGIVYYDGDPLSSAQIVFISETPEGTVKSSTIIREGIYQIAKTDGPVVGKAKVEIYPRTPELEELESLKEELKTGKRLSNPLEITIPAAYNKNSKLTADVTKDGKNTFEFNIVSK